MSKIFLKKENESIIIKFNGTRLSSDETILEMVPMETIVLPPNVTWRGRMIHHNFTNSNSETFDILIHETGTSELLYILNPFYHDYLYVNNNFYIDNTILWSQRPGKNGRITPNKEVAPVNILPDSFRNRLRTREISTLCLVKKSDSYENIKFKKLTSIPARSLVPSPNTDDSHGHSHDIVPNTSGVDAKQFYCSFMFTIEKSLYN